MKSVAFNGLEPQVHGLQGEGVLKNGVEKKSKVIPNYVVGLLEDLNFSGFCYLPAVPVLCCQLSYSLYYSRINSLT